MRATRQRPRDARLPIDIILTARTDDEQRPLRSTCWRTDRTRSDCSKYTLEINLVFCDCWPSPMKLHAVAASTCLASVDG
eukprot:scaffold648029_cov43-Prasinocladus_malaysianus.AAC.2